MLVSLPSMGRPKRAPQCFGTEKPRNWKPGLFRCDRFDAKRSPAEAGPLLRYNRINYFCGLCWPGLSL